ncbi:MAG: endonuclease III [Cyanobacteria bacterium]|nr:endonuclease III [Cyanobacteriota bacterium]
MTKSPKIKPAKTKAVSQANTGFPITQVLDILFDIYRYHPMAELTQEDPYKVLIACILSLRTKDETSIPASERLFALADTPEKMVTLTPETIQKLIFPVGFYRNKSETLIEVSQRILEVFQGKVPNTIEDLLTLKGVGRKTANLVMGLGHQLPAICVDVHVHRICNRLGYLQTLVPDESEMVLREYLPPTHWSIINKVMVLHGQQICRPIGPHCSECPVETLCQKIDVKARVSKTGAPKAQPVQLGQKT